MASRVLIRVAANVRTLALKPRPSYQWRCLASISAWRSNLPHTVNFASQNNLSVVSLLPVRRFASGTMTVQELEDKVQEVLRLFDKVDPEKVTLEAHFIDDLGLDSLDVVEIVMAFEDELGVEISDEEAEKILTAKDAAELLKKKLDIH